MSVGVTRDVVEIFFSLCLFVNAILFIPQSIKLFKTKSSKNLSIITFAGFNVIQFAIVLHGIVIKDPLLIIGYVLSFVSCGTITTQIIYYKLKNKISQRA